MSETRLGSTTRLGEGRLLGSLSYVAIVDSSDFVISSRYRQNNPTNLTDIVSDIRTWGRGVMRGTGRNFGHEDNTPILVTGQAERVVSRRGTITPSSWRQNPLEAHTNGIGVGSQMGVTIEPVTTQPLGVTSNHEIDVADINEISPSEIQYGRGQRWGKGFQWGATGLISASATASSPTYDFVAGVSSWAEINSELVENILGRSRQIGLDTPTHTIPSFGPPIGETTISAATWASPETERRTDTWGFGRQYGQGYEFGKNENDPRPSIATVEAAGFTQNRGRIGAFSAIAELVKFAENAIGASRQLGLDVESHTVPALSPHALSRDVSASAWVGGLNQTVERLYGRGRAWGHATQFGTREEVYITTSVTDGPYTSRSIGSALWDRSIEQISFNGLGRGYAIGLGEQVGEFETVTHVYRAFGPTGVRTIGEARRIFRFWAINAQFPIPATEEIRTHDELSLTMRAKKQQVTDVLRPLFDASSGEVDVITKSGGSFEAFDTSQSGNQFTITPAHRQRPTRIPRDYLVDGYDEQIVDQEGGEYEVTVDFIPERTREPDEEYEGRDEADHQPIFEERQEGEWQFVLNHGTIATKSITKDIERGDDEIDLTMIMDSKQTQTFEESASYVEGITEREIPDGDNKWDDDSPNNRNTAYIVPPEESEGVFDEGNYRITGWTTRRINYESYEITASFVHSEDFGSTTEAKSTTTVGSLENFGTTTKANAGTGEGTLDE